MDTLTRLHATVQRLVRKSIRKLPKDDLEAIASAPTELATTLGEACCSAAKDEARRALDDLKPTLCRLYTTDVMSPARDEHVAIKDDRENIGVAIGIGKSIWFEPATLWSRTRGGYRGGEASICVCAYSDEGARLKTPQPLCCVYTRRWLGDVLLVVMVEHSTSEGSSTVYADYTDLFTSDQADDMIIRGSVPQFAAAALNRLLDRAVAAPHTD